MRALVFVLALLSAGAAHAQDRYALDPAHTQVGFVVDRFGFNNVLGVFRLQSGEVLLDAEHPDRSSVTATIDAASLYAGDATRESHLKGDRWLKTAEFPTMAFRSTSVEVTGESTARVTGDLTIMGATQPFTLDVTLNRLGVEPAGQRQAAGFSATGSLSRSAFGVAIAPNLIGDVVQIRIEALGYAQAATSP